MGYLKIISIALLITCWANSPAQIVMGNITVSQGTIITTNGSVAFPTGGSVVFNEGSDLNINSASEVQLVNLLGQTVVIPNLKFSGTGDKGIVGVIATTSNLSVDQGRLVVATSSAASSNSMIIGKDGSISTTNGAYVQGFLVHQGLGIKNYPLGFEGTLGTAELSITTGDEDQTLTGLAFLPQNSDFTLPTLNNDLTAISNSWLWVLGGDNVDVSEVTLLIPPEDESIVSSLDNQGVIVQSEVDGSNLLNLGGSRNGSNITSTMSATGPVLRLAGELLVELLIHNIITPNGDDQNDVLVIENIEQIEGIKKVTFLDRWGTQIGNNIADFKNNDPTLIPFFESFQPGNYICILELEDGRRIKQPITILKN